MFIWNWNITAKNLKKVHNKYKKKQRRRCFKELCNTIKKRSLAGLTYTTLEGIYSSVMNEDFIMYITQYFVKRGFKVEEVDKFGSRYLLISWE